MVDSGGTNIGSVRYALDRLGADARLTSSADDILAADRVILPGVGAAGAGMRRLREAGLVEVLRQVEQPLLGVCLGMQLLFERSAEDGGTECLGLLAGEVVAIPPAPGLRVPHMGWNTLTTVRDDPLTAGLTAGTRAYFVHSYAVPVTADTLQTTEHSGTWSAVVRNGQRWGAQFHPERSASAGSRLLTNFLLEVSP
nr:imidazole glycerol phosphate synthase subunit HisH [Ornithinimicrobium sp. F0845]